MDKQSKKVEKSEFRGRTVMNAASEQRTVSRLLGPAF